MSILSALKSSTGNWDIARITLFKSSTAVEAALLYSVFSLHQVPTWSDVGVGIGAIMAGGVALIGGKEVAVSKANATAAATAAGPTP